MVPCSGVVPEHKTVCQLLGAICKTIFYFHRHVRREEIGSQTDWNNTRDTTLNYLGTHIFKTLFKTSQQKYSPDLDHFASNLEYHNVRLIKQKSFPFILPFYCGSFPDCGGSLPRFYVSFCPKLRLTSLVCGCGWANHWSSQKYSLRITRNPLV